MKLFTYCLRRDTGAAPNPFGGYCTLALTKPVLRRNAEVGDWIVGLASGESGLKDANRKVVFAMKVTQIMNYEDYNMFCLSECQDKLPARPAQTYEEMVGDCIYDFSVGDPPAVRDSVHESENMEFDLAGEKVLISDEFYYFGKGARELPPNLYKIIKKGQGFQQKKNDPFIDDFLNFIKDFKKNEVDGAPINKIENWYQAESRGQNSGFDLESDQIDEKIGEK